MIDVRIQVGDNSDSLIRKAGIGDRETPDIVAARVHVLALVVGDLAGAYNDLGIRRWFHRKRTVLHGDTPATYCEASGGRRIPVRCRFVTSRAPS